MRDREKVTIDHLQESGVGRHGNGVSETLHRWDNVQYKTTKNSVKNFSFLTIVGAVSIV